MTEQLTLRVYPDPVLDKECTEVPQEEIASRLPELLQQMKEIMLAYNGAGLAAPQVGLTERFIVLRRAEDTIGLVNPTVVEKRGSSVESEGCLSVPGIFAKVKRASHVRIAYLDESGNSQELEAEGREAHIIQHEIDHLDGILFVRYASAAKRPSINKALQQLAIQAGQAAPVRFRRRSRYDGSGRQQFRS